MSNAETPANRFWWQNRDSLRGWLSATTPHRQHHPAEVPEEDVSALEHLIAQVLRSLGDGEAIATQLEALKAEAQKQFEKAVVYGTIAAHYTETFKKIEQSIELDMDAEPIIAEYVKQAFEWRHSEPMSHGVPQGALDTIATLLMAQDDLADAKEEVERLENVIRTGGAMYRAERSKMDIPGGIDREETKCQEWCASYDFDPEKQLGPDKACNCKHPKELVDLAEEVLAGKTRSHVGAAARFASYLMGKK